MAANSMSDRGSVDFQAQAMVIHASSSYHLAACRLDETATLGSISLPKETLEQMEWTLQHIYWGDSRGGQRQKNRAIPEAPIVLRTTLSRVRLVLRKAFLPRIADISR